MKKYILFFVLVLLSINSFAKAGRRPAGISHTYDGITIISDLDDTIKITHVGDNSDTVLNSIFREKLFAGTSPFFQELISPNQNFYIVSGSPKFLKSRIEDVLEDNHMPKAEIILKSRDDGATNEYKIRNIKKIINSTQGNFILLGDDTEYDPQVLLTIKNEFPERVIGTYIRSIRGKKMDLPLQSFLTVYEVANYEVQAKRLDKSALAEIEKTILNTNEKLIIPNFVSCALLPELKEQMSQFLADKISDICKKKDKGN